MGIKAGAQPTHKLLVKAYADRQYGIGELVHWEGKPSWQAEPLDEKEREAWEAETADPARVSYENHRVGGKVGRAG